MSLFEKITQARLGGKVERCHTIPHQGSYSVAAHSWGVAVLMVQLFPNQVTAPLLISGLAHDVPEAWVGDIPSPTFKRVLSGKEFKQELLESEKAILNRLSLNTIVMTSESLILTFCDAFELLLWAVEERSLGNLYVDKCIGNLVEFMQNTFCRSKLHEYRQSGAILLENMEEFQTAYDFFNDFMQKHRKGERIIGDYTL